MWISHTEQKDSSVGTKLEENPFNIVPIWRYLAEQPIVRMVLQRAGEAAWMREDRAVMASLARQPAAAGINRRTQLSAIILHQDCVSKQ